MTRPDDAHVILPEQAVTLDGLFRARVKKTPATPAYRYFSSATDDWRLLTWKDIAEVVGQWRAALQGEDLQPGDRVALMLSNCCEWVQFEQAALSLGLVVVPLYVNDRADNIGYILEETQARVLIISDEAQWAELSSVVLAQRELTRIVTLKSVSADDKRVCCVDDWLPERYSELLHRNASPDDLATIVYTSGTTGRPKGVMLSHRNILWNAWAGQRCSDRLDDRDLFLSFLPLSHMLERTAGYYIPMMVGAEVAFARSIPQLADDLMMIKPTVLISVPRIYERIYAKIQGQMDNRPALEGKILRLAARAGWADFCHRQKLSRWSPLIWLWPLLQKKVASKVMQRLGGRVHVAICGGAPLAKEISQFFIGLGLPLQQGYGMTETAPVLNVNRPWNNDPQSVGPALEGVEEQLSADGELLARGPGIMLGYWNNEQATHELIDEQGWLHTGDIARIDQGRVYITGRLKDIIVMSNGEKVSPADLELAISNDPLFEQVMIIGEAKPFLTALLELSAEHVAPMTAQGVPDKDQLCRRIASCLSEFPGYVQVRRIAIIDEPWTVEAGLLTPTLKLKRNQIAEYYSAQIDELYAGH